MLQFLRPADPVFHAILTESLLTLKHFTTDTPSDDERANWPMLYPRLSRCLTPEQAHASCLDLLTAHQDQRVWQFTDMHALIIWESLFVFTNVHAESIRCLPSNPTATAVGPFSLKSIDLQWIETLYFPTIDFLNAADYQLSSEFVQLLDWSESARRAANGLPARAADLTLTQVTEDHHMVWTHAPLTHISAGATIHAYPTWMEPISHAAHS